MRMIYRKRCRNFYIEIMFMFRDIDVVRFVILFWFYRRFFYDRFFDKGCFFL